MGDPFFIPRFHMDDMIFPAEAPPVQNWYDRVPLNDIAKRGLREIEKRFREAAGDWSLVAASQLDEAEVHAGEHFQSWLAGCLGLTPSQATRIRAMSLQALQDREALRMAQEGMRQTEIGKQLGLAQNSVSVAVQRASTTISMDVDNAVTPPIPGTGNAVAHNNMHPYA